MTGRVWRGVVALLVWAATALSAEAIEVYDRYRSPRNPERKVRQSTDLIVLHTTEAPARSSLRKVSDRGECHYCITEDGCIYRIVDREREAFHAGRSMWKGREDVDTFSVGVECVGYHDKPLKQAQMQALARLVKELQAFYHIPDESVVCHGHVAYGASNRWHKFRHRGRKRCGMLFAMPSVRAALGLVQRPSQDADVQAKRLRSADEYLNSVLYGSVDTMRGKVLGVRPTPGLRAPPQAASAVAGSRPAAAAEPSPKSVEELKARGYEALGSISPGTTASKLAGGRWNAADTYYTIRSRVVSGADIDQAHIEKGMTVWRRPAKR